MYTCEGTNVRTKIIYINASNKNVTTLILCMFDVILFGWESQVRIFNQKVNSREVKKMKVLMDF